ncbi:MAG: ATP-dependent DNA helicase RecQ [Actinomycetia bacterium]|nr:ATP-dependent DNA helicase RecQ [Actinomycetes bacterium]
MITGALVEPPRPTAAEVEAELTEHIRALAGPDAVPRPEQLAAVQAVVADRQRTLLVARTGFGKSGVYFSATRMLRNRGWGPTIVVSPLLALMRDQVEAAQRLGLVAETINSANLDDWSAIEARIHADEVDLLLIAPERLANAGFRRRVFDMLLAQSRQARPFSLVCDEAHCISDWGHDFRPDYRRLRALLDELPPWTPVLATTATANQRVTDDVAAQLGRGHANTGTLVLRTSLDRASLHLSVVDLPDDAHRLAWLAENIDDLPGSGIIYCLTVNQAETTAAWLRQQGHRVAAYTGAVEPEERLALESGLKANDLKALVATSALGMGFDKGDLAFCVHLGLPPTPVAYYQQIGRAGRNLDRAEVIALPRPAEDAAVWRWFESVSLPSEEICLSVLARLDIRQPTSIATLETSVNLGRTRLGTLLNILEVDGAVERVQGGFVLTDGSGPAWEYNHELAQSLRELRRAEAEQMREWAGLDSCRLRYLRESLDDTEATDCGRCDVCTGGTRHHDPALELVTAAQHLLRGTDVGIEPRKQWPTGLDEPKGRIKPERRAAMGRSLAQWGDGGWGPIVDSLIEAADRGERPEVTEALVRGLAGVLKRWTWGDRPTWICPVPSRRRSPLIGEIATRLGELGNLPVFHALVANPGHPGLWQASQGNSAHQVANVWGRLDVVTAQLPTDPAVSRGPVLLVDDEADSRWTLTVAAWLLTGADAGPVLPLVLRAR